MAKPASRQQLIDYCLRQLGAPILEINVDESQVEDLVDDALQLYKEFHYDGSVREYRKHLITASDISNQYITIPDTIESVIRVLPFRSQRSSSGSLFDIRYQIHLNDIFDLNYAGSISHLVQTKQYIDLLEKVLHGYDEFVFSRLQDRLYFPSSKWGGDNGDIREGEYIIIECYTVLDETTYTEIFNDRWLKKYLTALIKKQWGANLKKFSNVALPGGAILDGQQMFDEASSDIELLAQELRDQFEAPLGIIYG